MSRRSLRKSAFDESGGDEVGLQELDQLTYGLLGAADKNRVVAEGRPIKDIYPDLRQPRRAIPSAVRLATTIDPQNMHTLFEKWKRMAEKECNTFPLRVQDMVEGLTSPEDDDALLEEMPAGQFPVTVALLKVIELARDIRENNLINPVTVVRTGRIFKLNTGERRWLAYHLLEWLYGSGWSHIPSHETNASVWTQASENLSRQDLDGIALARQFALLVMECFPQKSWGDVEDFTEGACDRAYYAQVGDGNVWKIPRGMGQKIATAMGVGESTLRTYRQILNVPDEIWTKADDEVWSTNAIREWILKANKPDPKPRNPESPNSPSDNTHEDKSDTDTVCAHTVSGDGYVPLTAEQRAKLSEQANKNDDGFVQKTTLDKAEDAGAPKSDEEAAYLRKYAVEGALTEIYAGFSKLQEQKSVAILELLTPQLREEILSTARRSITKAIEVMQMLESIDHDLNLALWRELHWIDKQTWAAQRAVGSERVIDEYLADLKNKMLLVVNWWKYTLEQNPDLLDGQLPALKEVDEAFVRFSEWVKAYE